MTEFTGGQTCFLPTGEKVTLDHIHGGYAYVNPVLITQSTNYNGDDFEEHEHDAEHLICVPVSKLFAEPPVESLEKEVSILREQIATLNAEKTAERNDVAKARKEFMELSQQVINWRCKNPCFDRITKLLNGEHMFALMVPSWKYRCDMPKIVDTDDAAALQLVHKGSGKFGWLGHWRQDHDRYGDTRMEAVEFFDTEAEMQAFVVSLWDVVLANFAKTSEDGQFGHVGVTGKLIKYETLVQWVERFPFLSIPSNIEADKQAYEAKNKAGMLAAAKARVAELEKA